MDVARRRRLSMKRVGLEDVLSLFRRKNATGVRESCSFPVVIGVFGVKVARVSSSCGARRGDVSRLVSILIDANRKSREGG